MEKQSTRSDASTFRPIQNGRVSTCSMLVGAGKRHPRSRGGVCGNSKNYRRKYLLPLVYPSGKRETQAPRRCKTLYNLQTDVGAETAVVHAVWPFAVHVPYWYNVISGKVQTSFADLLCNGCCSVRSAPATWPVRQSASLRRRG